MRRRIDCHSGESARQLSILKLASFSGDDDVVPWTCPVCACRTELPFTEAGWGSVV